MSEYPHFSGSRKTCARIKEKHYLQILVTFCFEAHVIVTYLAVQLRQELGIKNLVRCHLCYPPVVLNSE